MDVGVYTTRDVLDHKKRDGKASDGQFCYWTYFWGLPKGFNDEDFFFVAVEGHWEGLFSNCWTDVINGVPCICFHSEDWHELPAEMKTSRKPFQGYTKKVPIIPEIERTKARVIERLMKTGLTSHALANDVKGEFRAPDKEKKE